jgi:DNA invertase Pin-like site-specific DNA recombinase
VLVRDRYDDGGFSGGTLERPALQRLLADIEQGRIDVIVVYKIDRLSRSLMDFAKLVEAFEAHRVTFVSVTQSFNTTTSMGRLTLNILLSFAQFEREFIGERIRDKVAASKAGGMWMGGKVPLGYDVANRKLVVNEAEAVRVRRVFELFVETGSGVETVRRLQAGGITSKSSKLLDKGDVYKALSRRTCIGEVTHKGNIYLQVSPRTRAAQNRQHAPALLNGLIFGIDGRALSPTHCVKKGRQYRYYVAQAVLRNADTQGSNIVRRVSAAEIEGAVVDQVRALLRQPEVVVGTWLAARSEAPDLKEGEVREALARLDPLWGELFPAEQARIVRMLVDRVVVGPAAPTSASGWRGWPASSEKTSPPSRPRRSGRPHDGGDQLTVWVPLAIRRRPGRRTVVTPVRDGGETALPTCADPALVKALARAFRYQRLLDGPVCLDQRDRRGGAN